MNKVTEAWEWLKRFGTQADKERFRPVYTEMEKLKKRVAELEKIHDQYMAPQMFAKPPTDKEILINIQKEKIRKEIETPWQSTPLKDRLKEMVKQNQVGSKLWNQTLQWNKLTEEKAMELINDA